MELYTSTRGMASTITPTEVILKGIAEDGGYLYQLKKSNKNKVLFDFFRRGVYDINRELKTKKLDIKGNAEHMK